MCPTGRPGPGTGHRPVTGLWFFVKISGVTMTDSESEDDGWEQGSRDEEQSEEGVDDVQEVEASVKSEDMARVRQHKEFLWTEVAKNEPTSLVDRWFRDHIQTDRWDLIAGVFPQGDKYSPNHKWVLMTPDKEHKLHSTFGNLPKTYPTLWICCAHYNCMSVYDVTNSNDTKRNFHLTDNHTLGMKTLRGHKTLQTARQDTLTQRNVSALSRNMTMTHLAQLRVARYFIRKMCPFSQCEDTSYREQTVSDWVSCCRDTQVSSPSSPS
jgi:hypothetical protein